MNAIIDLPQFGKWEPKRKNAKNSILKEEEKVVGVLKDLCDKNKFIDKLFDKLKPIGSQPPRLYGLSKVHKDDILVKPVLSMPGSAWFRLPSGFQL